MSREKFENSGFARLFLWSAKAKYTMGIFFVAFVFVYLFFGFISEGTAATLDLFTAIQMVLACFLIGVLQQAILPAEKLSRSRSILWVASGVMITLLFSLVFKWFASLPLWCAIVFPIVLAMGMAALVLEYYLRLRRETKRLNRQLEQFQKRAMKMEG